jgi:hypothetical protein
MLWMGQIIEMDELVDPNGATDPTNYPGLPYHGVYEKGDLLNTLIALMKWFQPETVRALDSTGLALNTYGPNPDLNAFDPRIANCSPGCSTNPVDFTNPAYVSHFGPQDTLGLDPSVRAVWYTGFGNGNTGEYYNYDHSDHYFSALFAKTAIKGYAAVTGVNPTFKIYRGYNVTFLAPNVSGVDYIEKQAVFDVYGTYDTTVGPSGYYDPTGHYISWMSRQYGTTVVP